MIRILSVSCSPGASLVLKQNRVKAGSDTHTQLFSVVLRKEVLNMMAK